MKRRLLVYVVTTVTLTVSSPLFTFATQMNKAASSGGGAPTSATIDSVPTPRSPDGKPDLTGLWVPAGPGAHLIIRKDAEGRPSKVLFGEPDADFSKGDAQRRAQRATAPNQPPYQPQLLAKVKSLDDNARQFDGVLHCLPAGVPRIGSPQQIVETPGQVIFLYDLAREVSVESGNYFRVIPTDGRPHRTDLDPSYMGDSVGHWEGDTLVVDVTDFIDTTWIDGDGHFHSDAMHVIEYFTRTGNMLRYDVTVEDPNVLTKSWAMNPRMLKLDPAAVLTENPPCIDRDMAHMVTSEHH